MKVTLVGSEVGRTLPVVGVSGLQKVRIMKCPQCTNTLVEPRDLEKHCENCGYPEENRCEFTLVEVKAYLRSMFQKQPMAA